MSDKKEAKKEQAVPVAENKAEEAENAPKREKESVFVYLGKSVRGLIQEGTVLTGTAKEIRERFKAVTEKYPKSELLFVPCSEVHEVRRQIKQGSGLYANIYKSMST